MAWWQTDRPDPRTVRERLRRLRRLRTAALLPGDRDDELARRRTVRRRGMGGVLTPHLLASSLAYGTGLDDLPPATVGPLVDATLRCMSGDPDWTDWWIDDVVLELDGVMGDSTVAAECIATNYVRELGIERVVERRVLTLPVLTLNAADLAAIDASGCGADLARPALALGQVGDCLADVFRAACLAGGGLHQPAQRRDPRRHRPHRCRHRVAGLDATMNDRGRRVCMAAADAARATAESAADRAFTVWWLPPTRAGWEGGGRRITCIVGPLGRRRLDRTIGSRSDAESVEGVTEAGRVVPAQSPLAGGGDGRVRHLVGLAPHRHRHRSGGARGPVLTDREVAAAPTAAAGLSSARCGDRPRQLPGERGGGGVGTRGRVAGRRPRSCVWSSRSASPMRSPASRGRCDGSYRSPCPRSAATGAIA